MSREYVRQEKPVPIKKRLNFSPSVLDALFLMETSIPAALWQGQTCAQLSEIRPVSDILANLCGGLNL